MLVNSKQWSVNGEQWAVGGGRSVNGEQWSMNGEQYGFANRLLVGCGVDFCFLASGRWETVGMIENKSRFGSPDMWVRGGWFLGFKVANSANSAKFISFWFWQS